MKSGNITILGLQWGDEGKGKVVDYFTEGVDIVARFGGGANAGHTVVNDRGKFILHLLPSGFSFTSTITLIFISEGYRVEYLPIDYRKRKGWSKFRPIHDTFNMLILILRTLVYFNPLRVFLPLGILLLLLALPALLAWTHTGSVAWLVAAAGFLIASLQAIGVGMVADLLGKRKKK